MSKIAPRQGTLYRISSPHFVAGVLVDSEGVVRFAAPILRWSIGRKLKNAFRGHWIVERLDRGPIENRLLAKFAPGGDE